MIGSPLGLALAVDLATIVPCTAISVRFARLGHSHPGAIYIAFHLLVVTFRLISLALGADPLFSPTAATSFYDPVTANEILRASLMADLALGLMTAAWIVARIHSSDIRLAPSHVRMLEPRIIYLVVIIALPVGLVGLLLMSANPLIAPNAVDFGAWTTSGWLGITQTWLGLALLALIYWNGLRLVLVAPMATYLLVMAYQGFHRFRVIIPALLLCEIYLDRRNKRWPSIGVAALLVALALLFFPLKTMGQMAQDGVEATEIARESTAVIRNAFAADGEMQLLDEFAAGLTQIDALGQRYMGRGYLALVTLPIPRQWWPEKPGLADYLAEISTARRPMAESGMVITVLGEAYLNFGFAGVLVVPFALAYGLTRWYFAAYRRPYASLGRFTYLLVACNLFQVYRDGLSSIVVFTLVYMMPLSAIIGLHYFSSDWRIEGRGPLRDRRRWAVAGAERVSAPARRLTW